MSDDADVYIDIEAVKVPFTGNRSSLIRSRRWPGESLPNPANQNTSLWRITGKQRLSRSALCRP